MGLDEGAKASEPGGAIGVVERSARGHFRLRLRGVVIVRVDERDS